MVEASNQKVQRTLAMIYAREAVLRRPAGYVGRREHPRYLLGVADGDAELGGVELGLELTPALGVAVGGASVFDSHRSQLLPFQIQVWLTSA